MDDGAADKAIRRHAADKAKRSAKQFQFDERERKRRDGDAWRFFGILCVSMAALVAFVFWMIAHQNQR